MAFLRMAAPAATNGEQDGGTSTAGSGQLKAKPVTRAEWFYYAIAYGFMVIAGGLGIWFATHWKTGEGGNSFVPIEGISIFGGLYVVTLGLERLLEPLAALYGRTPTPSAADMNGSGLPAGGLGADQLGGTISKALATRRRNEALAAASGSMVRGETDSATKQANLAATWQQIIDQVASNTATLWAVAAGFGMMISGGMGLFVLHAIDRGSWDVPRWVDVIATGLIIGGGTKPLHDLITKLQKSKDRDSTPPQTSNTSSSGTG